MHCLACLGHNAIHVVKALGMYEVLIQALNGIDPTMQRFHYIEGSGSHEYLFEACYSNLFD